VQVVFIDPDGSNHDGIFVIVAAPTGVTYKQQCGGLLTEQQSLEGFLIPLSAKDQAEKIYQWFWDTFNGNCYGRPDVISLWTPAYTTQLRELVSGVNMFWTRASDGEDELHPLILDESRMNECIEAWIPVITPYGPGILTLRNSD